MYFYFKSDTVLFNIQPLRILTIDYFVLLGEIFINIIYSVVI